MESIDLRGEGGDGGESRAVIIGGGVGSSVRPKLRTRDPTTPRVFLRFHTIFFDGMISV